MEDHHVMQFWLPGKVEWKQLKYGDSSYIHAIPWLAMLILLLRNLAHFIADIVGHRLGVSNKTCNKPSENKILENAFTKNSRPSVRDMEILAIQLDWSAHHVRRWMHRARNYHKPSTLAKFKECSWRLIFYILSTMYGIKVLLNEPYFLDLTMCYSGYPTKSPSSYSMSYWCLQLALYISEIIAYLIGALPKKKDYIAMAVHHIVAIALLVICYSINMVPIGLVIALLHDVADSFLEIFPEQMAKLLMYASYSAMANVMFAIFSLIFIVTRLIILPNWVLPSLIYDLPQYAGHHSYITVGAIILILLLLCLHIYWLCLIVKVTLQLIVNPSNNNKDSRSDSELSHSE